MPTLTEIKQRLASHQNDNAIISAVCDKLAEQQWQARLSAETVKALCQQFNLTPVQLALNCINLAACYALTPVSNFNVGAVAIGKSGTFYFGANQEFAGVSMQQTVHAEQSAVSHAWIAGESAICDVVVNYTPCGHCRQFMNEMNTADELKIHLPHSQNNLLHSYLPDDFGPSDLEIDKHLFDVQNQGVEEFGDEVQRSAIQAMNGSYAPYSQAYSGVALKAGNQIFCGKYAENAAFNPSFLPLQSALNFYRLSGCESQIERIVFCEKKAILSHRQMSEMLAQAHLGIDIETIVVE